MVKRKIKENETKREKFQRLAEERLTKVKERIEVFRRLTNPVVYEYTEEDVQIVIEALDGLVNDIKFDFEKGLQEMFRPKRKYQKKEDKKANLNWNQSKEETVVQESDEKESLDNSGKEKCPICGELVDDILDCSNCKKKKENK